METNVIILVTSLLVIIVGLLILYLIYLFKYFKLRNEYYSYKRDMLKKSNKMNMIEYYIRRYKEHENIFTLFRDMSNVLYLDEIKKEQE